MINCSLSSRVALIFESKLSFERMYFFKGIIMKFVLFICSFYDIKLLSIISNYLSKRFIFAILFMGNFIPGLVS